MRVPVLAAAVIIVLLTGAAAQAQEAKPRSNFFARAKVLSKNELSITIRHSDWGQKNAYQFAADHCGTFGKLTVQATSGMGYGPDTTTTWVCQSIPEPPPPPAARTSSGAPAPEAQ